MYLRVCNLFGELKMNTLEIKGFTVRVEYESDNYETPWEWCDGHGKVRKSAYRHGESTTDKKPGERPMNQPDRNEYQFYYDWQASMKEAKRDGWNAEPCDAPNKAARAVLADFDYLCGWVNDEWQYVVVTVTLLDDEGDEITSDSLGMVETFKDYHETQALELATELVNSHIEDLEIEAKQARINARYHDAQNLGVTA
jgi:hypothetical protein